MQSCVTRRRLGNNLRRDLGPSARETALTPHTVFPASQQEGPASDSTPAVEERARQPGTAPQEAVLDVYLETNQNFARQQEGVSRLLLPSGQGGLQTYGKSPPSLPDQTSITGNEGSRTKASIICMSGSKYWIIMLINTRTPSQCSLT